MLVERYLYCRNSVARGVSCWLRSWCKATKYFQKFNSRTFYWVKTVVPVQCSNCSISLFPSRCKLHWATVESVQCNNCSVTRGCPVDPVSHQARPSGASSGLPHFLSSSTAIKRWLKVHYSGRSNVQFTSHQARPSEGFIWIFCHRQQQLKDG